MCCLFGVDSLSLVMNTHPVWGCCVSGWEVLWKHSLTLKPFPLDFSVEWMTNWSKLRLLWVKESNCTYQKGLAFIFVVGWGGSLLLSDALGCTARALFAMHPDSRELVPTVISPQMCCQHPGLKLSLWDETVAQRMNAPCHYLGADWDDPSLSVSVFTAFLTGVLLAGKQQKQEREGEQIAQVPPKGLSLCSKKFIAHRDLHGLQWVCDPGGLQACSYVLLFAFHSKLLRL